MTAARVQVIFDNISYPGLAIKIRHPHEYVEISNVFKVDLDFVVIDSRTPDFDVNVRRTFEIDLLNATEDIVLKVVFQEILSFLEHEAAENFLYRGQSLPDLRTHDDPVASVSESSQMNSSKEHKVKAVSLIKVDTDTLFRCRGRGGIAYGRERKQGHFLVQKGSIATNLLAPSFDRTEGPGLLHLRKSLIVKGILTDNNGSLAFSKDYAFNSPSTAASIIIGSPCNGRLEWKTADGRTLKEVQTKVTAIMAASSSRRRSRGWTRD